MSEEKDCTDDLMECVTECDAEDKECKDACIEEYNECVFQLCVKVQNTMIMIPLGHIMYLQIKAECSPHCNLKLNDILVSIHYLNALFDTLIHFLLLNTLF